MQKNTSAFKEYTESIPSAKKNLSPNHNKSTSSCEEEEENDILGLKIVAAPSVALVIPEDQLTHKLNRNIKPASQAKQEIVLPAGKAKMVHVDEHMFKEQFYNYKTHRVFRDPTKMDDSYYEKVQIGENENEYELQKRSLDEIIELNKSVFSSTAKDENDKRKKIKEGRVKGGDASSGDFLGPWAPYQIEEEYNKEFELTEERKESLKQIEEKRQKETEEAETKDEFTFTSTFHGKDRYDFQGRSFVHPPAGLAGSTDQQYYLPKKPIHTYKGHSSSVLKTIFFPKYGHFALSGSMDTSIRLWDVNGSRKQTMTYRGHKKAVKDLSFTNDGFHFISTGYDNRVNYWDTETGQVVQTFNLRSHPFCGQFNPDIDRNYAFLVGDVSKTITQFDVRSGEAATTYREHLGPVNTITFVDNNRKFASTSDDKKVFLWEFGVPIVVKHISDPKMNAISATDIHPNNKYFVGQSSDSKLLCFDVKAQSIRFNKKKVFKGHMSSGYSVGVKISPDGKFVATGDSEGRVFFYDWKSTKPYNVLQAHGQVCIGLDWHPSDNTKFMTCSWDGTIKLWES